MNNNIASELSYAVLQRRISKGEIQNPVLQAIKYEPVKKEWSPKDDIREIQVSAFDSIRRG